VTATNPVTVADLTNRALRTLSTAETTAAPFLLADAWSIIIAALPSVATRVEAGNPALQALVVQVECAMVLRVLSNPDGKLEEHVDDYEYRYDSARSTGSLYLSDAEAELLGYGDGGSDGAFTIKPAGVTPDDPWCPQPDWAPGFSRGWY
jgi:hypothetical protein